MFRGRLSVGVLGLALGLFAVPACGKFRKAKECQLLAETVSVWMKNAPAADPSLAEKAELASDARRTAIRYAELDRKLGALALSSAELVPLLARYRAMTSVAVRSLEDVAVALEQGDVELARRRRVEFGAMASTEAALVSEINAECRR